MIVEPGWSALGVYTTYTGPYCSTLLCVFFSRCPQAKEEKEGNAKEAEEKDSEEPPLKKQKVDDEVKDEVKEEEKEDITLLAHSGQRAPQTQVNINL